MSGGRWRCIFNQFLILKGCQDVGCGGGRSLLFKRHIEQNGAGSWNKDFTNDFDVLSVNAAAVVGLWKLYATIIPVV